MTNPTQEPPSDGVFVGIDTHRDVHHAAVIDRLGRQLADRQFPADPDGYRQLAEWASTFGEIVSAAIEGTSSYGAALTRTLLGLGWRVVETMPGDAADRRRRGKTDAADAFTAARAALTGRADATPKDTTGPVEDIRLLRESRRLLVRQQTQIMNQIKAFLVTAPADFREPLRHLSALKLAENLGAQSIDDRSAIATVTRIQAELWLELRRQAKTLQTHLDRILRQSAPRLIAVNGVGPDTAAALLVAAGQNTHRIRNEAALAHLFGIAPVAASSGNSSRFRLDRGGNRQGNAAIHRIMLVRLSHKDPRSIDFIQRALARGKTKRDAQRLLKRHLIREIHPILQDLTQ